MNCPVGTVKTRMYHGRQRLKYMLPNLAGLSRDTALQEMPPGGAPAIAARADRYACQRNGQNELF
jgi:hypothetical protein